ncbi:MAG: HU family DNA-binding protein [Muribaculaceae bacterium]|nr:HU family DNA-binding protein [Muribaculaceae bacterium]
MDSRQYLTALAKRCGRDKKDTEALLQGVARALAHHCGALDKVALPGFGSFKAKKHDEQIVTDRSTGSLMLLPPEIELTFRPGTRLRSRVEEADSKKSAPDTELWTE